jgi:hypothetical protein
MFVEIPYFTLAKPNLAENRVYIWSESRYSQRDHGGMLPSRGVPLSIAIVSLNTRASGRFRQRSTYFSEITRIERLSVL